VSENNEQPVQSDQPAQDEQDEAVSGCGHKKCTNPGCLANIHN